MNNPHKSGNGAAPFGGYTVTYIKNFLTWLSLTAPAFFTPFVRRLSFLCTLIVFSAENQVY
jgi:hypothetical protein